MLEAAEAGDQRAKLATQRYQHRPEFELYDVAVDPLQMNNLASDERHHPIVEQLKAKLDAWMLSQGDLGIETEMDARIHQGRARKKKETAKKKAGRKGE